jgi:predicted transcriptional regulator
MKTTIRTDGFEGHAKRAMARARKLDRGEAIEAEITLTFADPLDMLEVLTVSRVRLVGVARERKHSVSSVAAALKRDPKSVRRDVVKLERAGMLRTYEEVNPGHGRVRIVEPVAGRVELRASF